MIRHIIMFKFKNVKNDEDRLQKTNKIKSFFLPLRNIINVVESYEVAINERKTEFSYDVALISEFNTWNDLETYINHPEHKKAIDNCKDIEKEKAVIDYEF
ncbi:MAG: Dabb family protein [Bacteroidetes bacterium]|nr:Dabb family protein [Bacteroidota bacterium]